MLGSRISREGDKHPCRIFVKSLCEEFSEKGKKSAFQNETATWPHVYQMGPQSRGASNVTGASQGAPFPNLHNLQSMT